jgi:hypothetical protein
VFLKVGFILVKVHNPREYVDIDIYAKFHVVFLLSILFVIVKLFVKFNVYILHICQDP